MNSLVLNHSRNSSLDYSTTGTVSSTNLLAPQSEKFSNLYQVKKQLNSEKMAKPFCFSKLLVDKPWVILLAIIGIILVITALVLGLGIFRYNTGNDRQFLIWGADVTSKMDMRRLAQQEMHNSLFPFASEPHSTQYKPWSAIFVYRAPQGLLTPSILQRIVSFEISLSTRSDFQTFCTKNATDFNDICDELSFAPTFLSSYFKNYDISSQTHIDTVMLGYASSDSMKSFFGSDLTTTTLSTKYGRSYVTFGGPVQGYSSVHDQPQKQEAEFVQFLRSLQAFAQESSDAQLQILIASLPLVNDETISASEDDMLLAIAAFSVVCVYVTIHVRSIILAIYGMIQTLLAFPIAYFLYRVVFQITFYNTLNNASVFIIFGVAADDFFVFSDAWKQSRKFTDLNSRMAFTYRRASKAMFVTSFTTAAAFLSTGLSEVTPISSFGYFTAILIISNYFLVISMFPAMLILVEKWCGKQKTYDQICSAIFCCCCRKRENPIHPEVSFQLSRPPSISPTPSNESKNEIEMHGCIERCCYTKFNRFVKKKSIPLILLLVSWLGVAIYFTFQLQPLSQQETWLSNDNRIQRAYNLQRTEFPKTAEDTSVKVSLFWGVDELDRSSLSRWDDTNLGELVWDPSFTVSSIEAQQFIITLCDELRRDEGNVNGANKLTGGGVVSCFMQGFRDWLLANGKAFPVKSIYQFQDEMLAFNADQASLSYRNEGAFGFKNGMLHYIQIDALTPIDIGAASKIKQPAIDYWDNAITQLNRRASQTIGAEGLSRGKMTGELGFAFITAEQGFVNNAVRGILISGPLAFIVIALSTQNLIIAFYSILCIVGVIISVSAVMVLAGWEFGVSESIGIVGLIGFSVDYVVHLANHYVESFKRDRHSRIQEAYGSMGISIIGGAVTSLGSAVPLLFAKLTVFNKFGIFIISIVSFSVLFSLFLFGSLVHLAGPTGNAGKLTKLMCCCKKQKTEGEKKTKPERWKRKVSKLKKEDTRKVQALKRKNESSNQLNSIQENQP